MSKPIWSAAIYRRFHFNFGWRSHSNSVSEAKAEERPESGDDHASMVSAPHAKLLLLITAITCLWTTAASAGSSLDEPPTKTREIYVPSSDLKILLESEPHRVLLSRQEYDELVKKAEKARLVKKTTETHVPHATVTVSSDYDITVDDGRARLHGAIGIEVLEDGLHAVPLDFGGVGLLAAKLDDQPAPIGYAADGRLNLLVSGLGRHQLTLDMVAPLEMNSAQQYLSFRLTNAAVGRWRLTVPGDVEIKGGADVVSRTVDGAAKITRFELLPCRGDCTILMSLNSHLQRREQAVASRCLLFDEVTEAYEKLHATVTFWILHRAVDHFRFLVPEGFEITEINSPLLARWDIETEAGRKIVNVRLREQTTDTVVLSIAAVRTPSQLKSWRLPRLELLDVVGQVTVLGLLVQDDLKVESLTAKDLIPVDAAVLATALPATLVRPEPGAVPLRYIAAYYAPQGGYELKADFNRAAATLAVTTNLVLSIQDKGCEVQGGFALLPTAEKRFSFDFSVPARWTVTEVFGPDKSPLVIERYMTLPSPVLGRGAGGEGASELGRVHVKLPQGIAPGQIYVASFRAQYTPPGWLSPWKSRSLEFPMFRVAEAQCDEGAVAVTADEDLEVRPEKVARLVPITEAEMARFGMAAGAMNLAYRYEGAGAGAMHPWSATIAVDRTGSRATARTFAFFQIVPEVLKAHYMVIYTIEDAKTRRLSLLLPDSTPEALTIRGLDGVSVKEFTSEPNGTLRRWNVLLDEARRGEVRLEVDFEMRPQTIAEPPPPDPTTFPFPEPEKQKPAGPQPDAAGKVTELKDFGLPLLTADAVVYQSGMVAIEGDLELGVEVKTDARRADVGQLAIAKYTPASLDRGPKPSPMRLLGTYDFVGETPKVTVDVVRNPSYPLTPAIVERARLTTLLSADGTSQTQAVFQLRTKAPYLEIELPENASLWSAVLDATPLKPQMRNKIRLIGLPPGSTGAVRNLQLVYEAPVQNVTNGGRLNLTAPRLAYRASREAKHSTEIPLVNIEWAVTMPDGYDAVATDGTMEARPRARVTLISGLEPEPMPAERPVPAPLVVAGALYDLGGGVHEPISVRETAPKSPAFASSGGKSAPLGKVAMQRIPGIEGELGDTEAPLLEKNAVVTKDAKDEALKEDETVAMHTRRSRAAGKARATPFQWDVDNAAPARAKAKEAAVVAPPLVPPAAVQLGVVTTVPAPYVAPPPTVAALPESPVTGVPSADSPLSSEVLPEPAKPAGGPSAGWGYEGKGAGLASGKDAKAAYRQERLSGVRSLKIDVEQTGMDQRQLLTFSSLGANPQIGITLARRDRTGALAWGLALAVFLLGVALTTRPVRQKVALVLGLALASALLPLAWDTLSMAQLCNGVFYAASLLVPYYLAAGLVCWVLQRLRGLAGRITGSAPAAVAIVVALITLFSAAIQAQAGEEKSHTAEREEYVAPVTVPNDALIVPYDVKSKTGIKDADHLLVPYDRYVALWNLANPDKKLDAHPTPMPYALSGAVYNAVLEGEEALNITGQMQINVLAKDYVAIPLGLRGGVLARADLDGKPAQLKVVSSSSGPVWQGKGSKRAATAMDATLLVLQVSGKGSHKLELEVRLKLAHVGGWRGTTGSLPTAPAATVTFRVPQAQTEVRLGQSIDHRIHETQRPDETLDTALGSGGALQVQWRPKVAEAEVDRGLTVETASLLDVQEDGLRLALHLKLEFRRGQRDAFTLSLPGDYLVEKVAGNNVRGWEVKRAVNEQTVEVSLLKTAKESEQFNLFLSRNGKVGQPPLDTFAVPMVTVRDAALSSGQVTIRRSSLLDVRTTERSGVTRIDLGALPELSGGPATEESVLAIRPYEAYRFAAMPFVLRLTAAPVVAEVTADAQTSVKLDPTEPGLESKITFHVGQRRIFRFEIALPDDLRLPEVTLPSAGVWSIEKNGPRSILRIQMQQGMLGDVAVILRGKLAVLDGQREISLPRLEVLAVKRQEGDIAVQADPAFNVQARDLHDCQETELERVAAWLDPQFRAATRLALHYSGGYAGTLRLVPRTPEVVCDTVTNVRVTDRAIEETIILNFTIRNAGIHELTFLLPASMADARISTPMLRRKTISATDPQAADSALRVRLELQGDVMNDLRVLVENDRLLTPGSHAAPLPAFEAAAGGATGFVRHQYAVLQTSNRDELVVEPPVELMALSRQEQQWQTLSDLLGTKRLYQAYLLQPGAVQPRLSFHLQRHEEVETAGAQIDLAQTTIVVDANGAYRAQVELSLNNSSEQFLDVELPEGATLWAVHVAGEPVKPAGVPGVQDARHVLLPVRTTAKGDLNYLVVLKYGGKMPSLSLLSTVQFPLVRNVNPYPSSAGRTIGIEQSQVQIFVPKSHRWFAFGGKMHPTADEADLKAGRVAAFTKQGQRLLEATHDKDPFARVRATENLKNWVSQAEAQKKQEDSGRGDRSINKELQSQISANTIITEQAKDVLQSFRGQEQQDEAVEDNREKLNDLYRKQININGGALNTAGANSYTGGTTVNSGALQLNTGQVVVQNSADFNGNWITRNNLNRDGVAPQQVVQSSGGVVAFGTVVVPNYPQGGAQYSTPGAQTGTRTGAGTLTLGGINTYSGGTVINNGSTLQYGNPNLANGRIILNNEQSFGGSGNSSIANPLSNSAVFLGSSNAPVAQQQAQAQPPMPNSASTFQNYVPTQQAQGGEVAQQPAARRGATQRSDQQRELAEYQQKLSVASDKALAQGDEKQAERDRHAVVPSVPTPAAGPPMTSLTAAQPPAATAMAGNADTLVVTDDGGFKPPTAGPTVPAGLASLDFELPIDKTLYELYRFTTPRGEAELTARTISNTTLSKLKFLAGIVAVSLLVWAVFWLIRRGALDWFRRPLGAALLAIAGLVSLCGSLLPVVGLLALLTGIALLIAHFWRRRAVAA